MESILQGVEFVLDSNIALEWMVAVGSLHRIAILQWGSSWVCLGGSPLQVQLDLCGLGGGISWACAVGFVLVSECRFACCLCGDVFSVFCSLSSFFCFSSIVLGFSLQSLQ